MSRPLPLTLLRTPGVMGTLGALSLHLAAPCLTCRNGGTDPEGVIVDGVSPATMRDPEDVAERTCPTCEGRKIAVYVEGDREFSEAMDEALEVLEPGELAIARKLVKTLTRESRESFRLAHGRKPYACEKCGFLQDASTGSCAVCGGILIARDGSEYKPALDRVAEKIPAVEAGRA